MGRRGPVDKIAPKLCPCGKLYAGSRIAAERNRRNYVTSTGNHIAAKFYRCRESDSWHWTTQVHRPEYAKEIQTMPKPVHEHEAAAAAAARKSAYILQDAAKDHTMSPAAFMALCHALGGKWADEFGNTAHVVDGIVEAGAWVDATGAGA